MKYNHRTIDVAHGRLIGIWNLSLNSFTYFVSWISLALLERDSKTIQGICSNHVGGTVLHDQSTCARCNINGYYYALIKNNFILYNIYFCSVDIQSLLAVLRETKLPDLSPAYNSGGESLSPVSSSASLDASNPPSPVFDEVVAVPG